MISFQIRQPCPHCTMPPSLFFSRYSGCSPSWALSLPPSFPPSQHERSRLRQSQELGSRRCRRGPCRRDSGWRSQGRGCPSCMGPKVQNLSLLWVRPGRSTAFLVPLTNSRSIHVGQYRFVGVCLLARRHHDLLLPAVGHLRLRHALLSLHRRCGQRHSHRPHQAYRRQALRRYWPCRGIRYHRLALHPWLHWWVKNAAPPHDSRLSTIAHPCALTASHRLFRQVRYLRRRK